MHTAPETPLDEPVRLDKLNDTKLLDSAPEERFDRITRMAKRMFNVKISLISLVDSNRQWFKSKCDDLGLPDETSRDISFCGHAILEDDLLVIEDTLKDERFAGNPLVTSNPMIRFYAGFPIKIGAGSAIATLCIFDGKPRQFDEDDRQLLRDIGQTAELEIRALELANTDELTQLSNRRGFTELAKHVLSVSARKQTVISLCVIDLNEFKAINDTYGHAEGDRALTTFADIMLETLRESDVMGRMGGDEFALIINDSSEEHVSTALSRLKEAVEKYNNTEQRGYKLKFSFGSVTVDGDSGIDLAELFDKADRDMYVNKSAGKSFKAGRSGDQE